MKSNRKQTGFSLMELMVVVGIIGVLGAVAMPVYTDYAKKARYSSVIGLMAPVKIQVGACINKLLTRNGCDSAKEGIAPSLANPIDNLESLTVANGIITATSIAALDSLTYVLTPNWTAAGITWAVSGTCVDGNGGSVSGLC